MIRLSVVAEMNGRDNFRRYGFSTLIAIMAFAIVNSFAYWWRTPPCCDWTYSSGLPFRFMEEGGFVGIRRFLWGGVAADLGSIVLIALAINRLTMFVNTTKRSPHSTVAHHHS